MRAKAAKSLRNGVKKQQGVTKIECTSDQYLKLGTGEIRMSPVSSRAKYKKDKREFLSFLKNGGRVEIAREVARRVRVLANAI